jgi:predicted alpha/beta superfamily hydrolase
MRNAIGEFASNQEYESGRRFAMSHRLSLRVHYPLESGDLVLRTHRDWDRDIEPSAVSRDGSRFDFRLRLEETSHLYFKPVLRRGSEVHWAQGENSLALADGGARLDVYPHFFSETACSACSLKTRRSGSLGRDHSLRVFYPPGYEENTLERYPVLYMQDGQNLFFAQEAFGGVHWMVEETMRVLDQMNLVRKAIVVGVYPNDRMEDYTRPGYEEYGRYLVEDVKPWVDANYRTLPDPAHTAVMGSSLGGVVSFYLAWQHPDVFGLAGCLSSTFGYRDDLHERVEAEPKRPVRYYLDSGWPRDNYEPTRAMRNALAKRGYAPGRDLLYLAFPNAKHDEAAWSMRAHIPFQFFFGE